TWTSAEQGSADLGIWGRIYDVTGQPVTGDLALVVHPGGVRHDARSVARADGGFTLVYTESSGQDGSFDGVYTRSFGQDATPLGDEARVNVHTSDRQFDPEIAALDTGMIAVWSGSVPGDTSSHGIVGRFLGDDGTPVGSAFVLNTTTFNTQYGPRVTRTEDGFAVAWTTFATATASWEVVYQRFLANGSLVGPQLQVNTTHVGHQEVQDILALSDGGLIIAWQGPDASPDATGDAVFAQRLDAAGKRVGSQIRISPMRDTDQGAVDLVQLEDGRVLATWRARDHEDKDWGDEDWGVFAHYLIAPTEMAPFGPDRIIATQADTPKIHAATTALSEGGGVIVWLRNTEQNAEIMAQWVDPRGRSADAPHSIVSGLGADVGDLSVVAQSDGGFRVAWTVNSPLAARWTQAFDAKGAALAPATAVPDEGIITDVPVLITLASGNMVEVWRGDPTHGEEAALLMRHLAPDGTVLGANVPVAMPLAMGTIMGTGTNPAAFALPDGGYIVAWQMQTDTGGSTIQARRFDAEGQATSAPFDIPQTPGTQDSDVSLIPLDSGDILAVWQSSTPDNGDSALTARLLGAGNSPSDGTPVVQGDAVVGQTLTADLSLMDDPDGFHPSNVVAQWMREGQAIVGASDLSYILRPEDAGGRISLRVQFKDGAGFVETQTSAPGAVVTPGGDTTPRIVTLPDGTTVVIYHDTGSATPWVALLLDADGVARAPAMPLADVARPPVLMARPDGKVLIGWSEDTAAGGGQVNALTLHPDTREMSAPVMLASHQGGALSDLQAIALPGGGHGLVWTHETDGQRTSLMQPLTPTGTAEGVAQPLDLGTENSSDIIALPGG
ncbi:MAG: hypothetical protein ACPG7W_05710, partial [Paracoccaceae bacterium]